MVFSATYYTEYCNAITPYYSQIFTTKGYIGCSHIIAYKGFLVKYYILKNINSNAQL